jgi:uncharacterized protein YciI
MHALVLMVPSGTTRADADVQTEHERFIDMLDRANQVITGGSLRPPSDRLEGAYVLRCDSLADAREVAESDPLVRAGAVRCEVLEWVLVAFNPNAIDRGALLYP